MYGDDGRDAIFGGDDDDEMVGGRGDDCLVGGAGVDWSCAVLLHRCPTGTTRTSRSRSATCTRPGVVAAGSARLQGRNLGRGLLAEDLARQPLEGRVQQLGVVFRAGCTELGEQPPLELGREDVPLLACQLGGAATPTGRR